MNSRMNHGGGNRSLWKYRGALAAPALLACFLTGCGFIDPEDLLYKTPVKLVISWPARSAQWGTLKAVTSPGSAIMAGITLKGANRDGSDFYFTATRPDDPNAAAVSYSSTEKVRPGTYPLVITFYSPVTGGNPIVGEAQDLVTIQRDGSGIGDVKVEAMAATVEVIAGQTLKAGETKALGYTVRDKQGALVAVDPGSVFWGVSDGDKYLSFASAKATGLKHGIAKVVATVDEVSSAATKLVVTPVPRVIIIPTLPGADANDPRNGADAISADGNYVVGWSQSTLAMEAFRWSEAGGASGLGVLPGYARSMALAVSADGSVVVGTCLEDANSPTGLSTAFMWTEPNGMMAFDGFPDRTIHAEATGVSGDGLRVVGWYEIAGPYDDPNVDPNVDQYGMYGFVWDPNNGVQTIGDFISPLDCTKHSNMFTGISVDGKVLIGNTGYMLVDNDDPNITEPDIITVGTRWIQVGQYWEPTMLGWTGDNDRQNPPWRNRTSAATAVNADGSIIWGTTIVPGMDPWSHPFRWTPSTGMNTPIWGQLYTIHTQSHDGEIAAGGIADPGTGMMWDSKRGVRSMYGVMDELGILDQMGPYTVVYVGGVSADGQGMVGICGGNSGTMRVAAPPMWWPSRIPTSDEQGYFRAFYTEIPRENN